MSSSSSKKKTSSSSSSDKKLQEIQDALAELQRAKDEIARLNRERELAMEQAKKAAADYEKSSSYSQKLKKKLDGDLNKVDSRELEKMNSMTEKKDNEASLKSSISTNTPNYSSKSYWDLRYEEEKSQSQDNTIYEWYLSFEQIRSILLRDIRKAKDRLAVSTCRVYMPGCGNSTLGEDMLALDGIQEIVASDFSSVVIQQMQERCAKLPDPTLATKLRYRVDDLCHLQHESDQSYDLIVDKGTLDAISSSSSQQNHMDSIRNYITEMWRILKIHGCFIIITNMPISVLDSLILQPMLHTWDEGSKDMVATYALLHQEIVQGDGDGEIFYYSIQKYRHLVTKKDVILSGIHTLLDEAKKAKLAQDWMEEEMQQDNNNGKGDSGTKKSLGPLEHIVDKDQAQYDGKLPNVQIQILFEESDVVSEGHVMVEFTLQHGSVEDRDLIRLVLDGSSSKGHDTEMYLSSEMCAESFDYADNATMSEHGKSTVGKLKLPLPCYAMQAHISYLRDISTMNGSTEKKTYVVLAQSEDVLNMKFPSYPYNPVLSSKQRSSAKYPSRRGALPIPDMASSNQDWEIIVEDMQNIHRLQLYVKHRTSSTIMSRVMSFVYSHPTAAEGFMLLLEVDLITTTSHSHDNTAYASTVQLAYLPLHFSFSHHKIRYEDVVLEQMVGEISTDGRLCIRIPYHSNNVSSGGLTNMVLYNVVTNDYQDLQSNLFSSSGGKDGTIQVECKYCGQQLNSSDASKGLHNLHVLPTGLLDDNMHEFICCEEVSCLTQEDMNFQPHALYLSSTYSICDGVASHGASLQGCAYLCRETTTVLDLYTNIGSAMMTSALHIPPNTVEADKKRKFILNSFRSIIGVDYAAIRCQRCDTYLGDARLQLDENEEEDDASDDEEEVCAKLNLRSHFNANDIHSFKLLSHKVNLSHASNGAVYSLTLEQAIARICVYIMEKVSLTSVAFFIASEVETCIKADRDLSVICIRTMNKSCRVYHSADHRDTSSSSSQIQFQDCIKITFKSGKATELMKGKEARVPLDVQDFIELKKILLQKKAKQTSSNPALVMNQDPVIDLLL